MKRWPTVPVAPRMPTRTCCPSSIVGAFNLQLVMAAMVATTTNATDAGRGERWVY